MPLSDQELALFALREAELILPDYVQPGRATATRRSHNCSTCWTGPTLSNLWIGSKPKPGLGWPK